MRVCNPYVGQHAAYFLLVNSRVPIEPRDTWLTTHGLTELECS